ncbi:hypothetical protein OIU74_020300, partial [Salix koriyanagi]
MAGGLLMVGELLWCLWLVCIVDLGIWCVGLPLVDDSWWLD